MSEYYPITLAEMTEFLTPLGFKRIHVEGTHEAVFAKRVDQGRQSLSLRVNTGIEGSVSRPSGDDAMRVVLFAWAGRPVYVGGSKKVLRVRGWKANLKARLDSWLDYLPKDSCSCGLPMVPRKRKGEKVPSFLGCIGFPVCKNTRNIPAPAAQVVAQRLVRNRLNDHRDECEVNRLEALMS